jgi:hypothetical protein
MVVSAAGGRYAFFPAWLRRASSGYHSPIGQFLSPVLIVLAFDGWRASGDGDRWRPFFAERR